MHNCWQLTHPAASSYAWMRLDLPCISCSYEQDSMAVANVLQYRLCFWHDVYYNLIILACISCGWVHLQTWHLSFCHFWIAKTLQLLLLLQTAHAWSQGDSNLAAAELMPVLSCRLASTQSHLALDGVPSDGWCPLRCMISIPGRQVRVSPSSLS